MTDWLNKCHFGDCLETLQRMPDCIVNTCVTSPPYFGLRDYGVAPSVWPEIEYRTLGGVVSVPAMTCCLGLEPTPEAFVGHLVLIFRGVHRVMRDDGTLWLNLGDSYAGSWGAQSREHAGKHAPNISQISANQVRAAQRRESGTGSIPEGSGLKPKDLMGIPWMAAFALRCDGWYLRQENIWAKPNPMPESMKDRCTKSHEQLFMLSKSPSYYFDHAAIQEPAAPASIARWNQDVEGQVGSDRVPGKTNGTMKAVGGARSKRDSFKRDESKRAEVLPGQAAGTHRPDREESEWDTERRNKRSVWTVSTKPYKGAHFATFPPDLIEPCILAGAPAGGVVLDPFFGSGTTGQVSQAMGRKFIGIELNTDYKSLQDQRLQQPSLDLEAA